MTLVPSARFTQNRSILALAGVPLVIGIAWGIWHVVSVVHSFSGGGSPMATTFLVSLMLLWWVPLSWWERPHTVTAIQQRALDELIVTVHVPIYNEEPTTLREALSSILNQSRRPDRFHVVDDGSNADYSDIQRWFERAARDRGIAARWVRTPNRGKRHAQMETLCDDDADIFVTLDSDSTLDRSALAEGLKPFANPRVTSVAGMVVVWNSRDNILTRLTCMLYTPFTRGFRSAQSVLGQVLVNSGTLAFYRAAIVRKYAGTYEHEQFMGRQMQMNDDSMLTFYALLEGRTVHQPSSVAFTVAPSQLSPYLRQQLRWMRGTFIRTWWWVRYLSPRRAGFWMPLLELVQFVMVLMVVPAVVITYGGHRSTLEIVLTAVAISVLLNYLCALRYFVIERSDESGWLQLSTFLLAPLAGLWRFLILRPMMLYAKATFWKVDSWGTRQTIKAGTDTALSRPTRIEVLSRVETATRDAQPDNRQPTPIMIPSDQPDSPSMR